MESSEARLKENVEEVGLMTSVEKLEFYIGAKVVINALSKSTLVYKSDYWPDQSRLNGSTAKILRREGNQWIIELSSSKKVSQFFVGKYIVNIHTKIGT